MRTLHDSAKQYAPAIRLTGLLSRRWLTRLRLISALGAVVSAGGGVVSYYFLAGAYLGPLWGTSVLLAAVWLEQTLTMAYHNSFYYRGLNSTIGQDEEPVSGATYEVAAAVLRSPDDVTRGFLESSLGYEILRRCGIPAEAIATFRTRERPRLTSHGVLLPEGEIFSLIGVGKYLYKHDAAFARWLQTNGVHPDTFHGALRWIIGAEHRQRRRERWWGKDNLSRTTGIGQDWAYGTATHLAHFSRDIRTTAVFSTLGGDTAFAAERIDEIEHSLARSKAANVLLVGEPGIGKIDLVMTVARRMQHGESLDAISGKRVLVLDTDRIFAACDDSQALEHTIISLFDEATAAGNLIIVIEHLSTVIEKARALNVFLPELLDTYLAIPELQIIATDTPTAYHTHLEPLGAFTRRFAEILIDTPDVSAAVRVLEQVALAHEPRYGVLFHYAAVRAIATAADRYLVEGVMPDKAIGLLVDVASKAKQAEIVEITEDYVYTIVSEKTGIPAGPIASEERDRLLHLEDRLHQLVVGQEPAISAIARTMRRARSGIQDSEKPIGSFLFLGPTGVGKTETAKALATVFFGGEHELQRLDMSEYSGDEAVGHLIGTATAPGALPTLLREHPYCVLLLDEFEKASQSVHDVFLQILDEGRFTDARGISVNARNTIIIATSNAGSQLILRTVQQRKELAHLTGHIIDHIVSEGTLRPELINRFDSTIIFEPLDVEQQTEVAGLMLRQLYERIRDRGYELRVSENLLDLLVETGYDPEYGARPMRRVLQDVIEEKVAQKIIAGAVKKGDTLTLDTSDFSEAELAMGK